MTTPAPSKWTPTPWEINAHGQVIGANDSMIAAAGIALTHGPYHSDAAHANAARIVYAVNNIERVETESAAKDARIAELEELLAESRGYIAEAAQEVGGYGFARPANPHDFCPDVESCTDEEIAAHKAACEAYDRGEYTPEKGDGWAAPNLHILKAPWGIGSYTFADVPAQTLLDRICAALAGSAT